MLYYSTKKINFMQEDKNSDIHLRPRFRFDFDENQQTIISKFKRNLKDGNCKYCAKIVGEHIIIDVPKEADHFWSPQLSIEVEKVAQNKSVVKGLFGPKPQVWTFFMFIHFAVVVAFIGFSIMAYVQYTLKQDYTFPLIVVIALPVFWFVLYFLGRLGKLRGKKQMDELHKFLLKTINNK